MSRMDVDDTAKETHTEAKDLTFRIRTTSVVTASASCYPREKRRDTG